MGSPFASLIVSPEIPLPFDQGQWVKVRKLTGRQYEHAQMVHRAGVAIAPDKWAGFARAAAADGPTSDAVKRMLTDPLTGFDRETLVREGLVAWSYDRPVKPVVTKVAGQPDQVDDAIADLDDDAIDFIAREVLKLTKPTLFVETPEASEAEKKSA